MEKNIFQVWYQGEKNIKDERFKNNVKQWQVLNPDWNYYCLDDSDLQYLCKKYSQKCIEAYSKSKYMHAKIDLGKLVALYFHGGIMIDMDMYAFRPLHYNKQLMEIIKNKDFMAVSHITWMKQYESMIYTQTPEFYNNAVVLASKKNKLIKKLIDHYISQILSIKSDYGNFDYINKTTGPVQFTKTIYKYKHLTKLFKLKEDVFESCHIDKCTPTNNTISLHQNELSWLDPFSTKILNLYFLPELKYIIVIIFLLFLYYFKK